MVLSNIFKEDNLKMKKLTTVISLLLAAVMLFAVVACKPAEDPNQGTVDDGRVKKPINVTSGSGDSTGEITVTPDYTLIDKVDAEGDEDWEAYKGALGDYYAAVLAANEQTDTSARYALQAIAEAKMLESGVFVPTTTQGGNYAISRVVPKNVSSALWGTDNDRLYRVLVCTDYLKAADREEVNKLYAELKGTGTFTTKVKELLEGKGYTFKDSYSFGYSSEPQTWDILATYRSADSEAIVNTYDSLVEYDNEGRLLGALATDLKISEDGLEYTFTLRQGVKWVTSAGQEYAEVKAEDFVTGLKHLLDAKAGLESLIFGIVKNAREYVKGDVTDFAQVGVTAVDDYTVKYTLAAPCPYFVTMLTYNLFVPMNKTYFEEQGEAYGTSSDNILYCGAYLVSNHTENNKIVFSANENYYAKDEVIIKTITWNYNDGSDVTKGYNDMKAGTIDGAGLNTTTLEMAKNDGLFDTYAFVSATNATSFGMFMNVKRGAYSTDGYEIDSKQTDEQKAATAAAMQNQNFRLALAHAFDRATYNATSVGDELKLASLRNSYTPGNYVALTRDVKIPINGTEQTFKAGTYYGAIMQAQIDADGYKMKVWDPTADGGSGSSDQYDGWYNVTAAKEALAKAVEELAAKGVTVSKENPIHIDYVLYEASETRTAMGNALKQSIEAALDGCVGVDFLNTTDIYALYYAGYYCDEGKLCNYDVYDVSGWGPDYGDPATYLNTLLPMYNGDMTHCLGVY